MTSTGMAFSTLGDKWHNTQWSSGGRGFCTSLRILVQMLPFSNC